MQLLASRFCVPRCEETISTERLAHLSDHDIDRYAGSRSNFEEERAIEQHILACGKCLQRVKIALRRMG